jgi:hypothetical protein
MIRRLAINDDEHLEQEKDPVTPSSLSHQSEKKINMTLLKEHAVKKMIKHDFEFRF